MPVFLPMYVCSCGAYHSAQYLMRREGIGGGRRKRERESCPKGFFFFLPIIVVETETHTLLGGFELLFKDPDAEFLALSPALTMSACGPSCFLP